jgi:hypothetical protein
MMKIREMKIDFDPPPQQQQQWAYYDIRQFKNSLNRSYEKEGDQDSSSQEEEDELDVSITWSNAPGIDDSPKSCHSTEYADVDDDMEELELNEKRRRSDDDKNNKTKRNDTAATFYDDEDENDSVFLSWPELPEIRVGTSSPQHEQQPSQQQQPLGEKVPQNQQWWQFGRRRSFGSDINNNSVGVRKGSVVESNNNIGSRRWSSIESYNNSEGKEDMMNRSGESNNFNGSSSSNGDGGSPEKFLHRQSSIESNRSVVTSSSVEVEIKSTTMKPNRRRSMDNNKSFTSSVDDEVNEWLFPRRGRLTSQRNNSTRGLWGGSETSSSSFVAAASSNNNPPQGKGEDDVEVIVDKLKKSFVDLSPIERALLDDMASTKNTNRWRNRSSITSGTDNDNHQHNGGVMPLGGSSTPKSLQGDDGELEEVSPEEEAKQRSSPHRVTRTPSQEDWNDRIGNAQQGVPEIYWDSDKMMKMKGCGVSLASARALDEVSSIASSDHSGKIPLMNNIAQRRASFKSSFFGWNTAISEEDVDENSYSSFKPEKIVPRVTTPGKLSSMASSIRPKSMVINAPSKGLSKAKKRSSIDYDDYDDDDDMYSRRKNPQAEEDLKHEAVVKEACEIMDSVNNSLVAMGMNAPFRPIEEICPPFQKLHKNLGYQMDALKAVTVRSTKSPTASKRQGTKKSKKLRASNFKGRGSLFSMSSGGSTIDTLNRSSNMSILNDTDAMSKFIISQMALMQSQLSVDGTSITSNVTPRSFYTSWLPNYMWYQTIAADASSVMRPTSLCSGTGITGDEQYLNPEMLKVFEMFSTYFVGSKHLFQEGEEDNDGAKMRRSYWMMEKIDEIDSDDEISENSSSSDSEVSDESDMVYELADVGADIDQFVDTERQIEILQSVIKDLRKSQMNDRPMLSIKAATSPQSNLSSSTASPPSNLSSSTASPPSNLSSSTISDEMI